MQGGHLHGWHCLDLRGWPALCDQGTLRIGINLGDQGGQSDLLRPVIEIGQARAKRRTIGPPGQLEEFVLEFVAKNTGLLAGPGSRVELENWGTSFSRRNRSPS